MHPPIATRYHPRMQLRVLKTSFAAGLLSLLACACGQKGPLYQPDEGVEVAPALPASAPAPATSPVDGVQAPVTPGSPDRSDEPRKRIHTP
jgi:predicted small lipoprotein YifL